MLIVWWRSVHQGKEEVLPNLHFVVRHPELFVAS